MKKLLSAALFLLLATPSCIFVVSDSDDCEACSAERHGHSDHNTSSAEHVQEDGTKVEYYEGK